MLRAGPIEPMGKKKNHACLSQPLCFRALYVLVYYKLGWVVEVAKLGFPYTKVFRAFQTVAILIGHRSKLA